MGGFNCCDFVLGGHDEGLSLDERLFDRFTGYNYNLALGTGSQHQCDALLPSTNRPGLPGTNGDAAHSVENLDASFDRMDPLRMTRSNVGFECTTCVDLRI